MLTVNPHKRITAAEALKHPWISVNLLWSSSHSTTNFEPFSSNVNVSHQLFIVKRLSTAWRNSTHGGNWKAQFSPQCWPRGTFPVRFQPPLSVPNPIFTELLLWNKLFGQAKASLQRRKNHLTRRQKSRRYRMRRPTTLTKTMALDWDDKRLSKWRNSWSKPSTAETSTDTRETHQKLFAELLLNFLTIAGKFATHTWLLSSQNRWETW